MIICSCTAFFLGIPLYQAFLITICLLPSFYWHIGNNDGRIIKKPHTTIYHHYLPLPTYFPSAVGVSINSDTPQPSQAMIIIHRAGYIISWHTHTSCINQYLHIPFTPAIIAIHIHIYHHDYVILYHDFHDHIMVPSWLPFPNITIFMILVIYQPWLLSPMVNIVI